MNTWIKISFRNLIKNKRRSLVTGLAIALGFAAVNIFSGFANYMYAGSRDAAIYAHANGHLTLFKEGYLEKGKIQPGKYLLQTDEIQKIEEICSLIPEVELVTPQLQISGLVTNGNVSTIFIGTGIVPSATARFLSKFSMEQINDRFSGNPLRDDASYGVGVATGLAKILEFEVGSDGVAFSNTVDGQMNALDLQVFQLFNAGSDELNDKVMRVPLEFARGLYDTEGADRLAVLLSNTNDTDRIHEILAKKIEDQGLSIEIKDWVQMSSLYRKVKSMFDVIFAFLFVIVFIIVVMSVINTMSMSIVERTREIGTLRALGLKRKKILSLFAIESAMIGSIGILMGGVFTALALAFVLITKPTWIPPGVSSRVPIRLEFDMQTMAFSCLFLLILCGIASFIPARGAVRQNIVDALGHV